MTLKKASPISYVPKCRRCPIIVYCRNLGLATTNSKGQTSHLCPLILTINRMLREMKVEPSKPSEDKTAETAEGGSDRH